MLRLGIKPGGPRISLKHIFPRAIVKRTPQGGRRLVPHYQHIGPVETAGHRTHSGRWIKARGALIKPSTRRYQPGVPHQHGWTHPYDLIEKWSVSRGDKVRLMTGTAARKYVDPEKGVTGGYKVWTVQDIDMRRNRVYLDGMTQKKSTQGGVKPANFDQLTQKEQDEWTARNEVKESTRSVQVSNISLLVEEHPTDPSLHIWARRIKTGKLYWDNGRYKWQRFAAAVTGQPSSAVEKTEQGWVIPWTDGRRVRGPNDTDSDDTPERREEARKALKQLAEEKAPVVQNISMMPITVEEIRQNELGRYEQLIPTNLRARPPATDSYTANEIADSYASFQYAEASIDTLMPLHLGEELGPRFARHKIRALYKVRYVNEQRDREEYIKTAVADWEARGRDRGLREIMDRPEVGLAGVPLRYRTRKEVQEAAELEFNKSLRGEKQDVAWKIARGYKYDHETNKWKPGPKVLKLMAKKAKKAKKAVKLEDRLARLTLQPKPNMVVPPAILKQLDPEI